LAVRPLLTHLVLVNSHLPSSADRLTSINDDLHQWTADHSWPMNYPVTITQWRSDWFTCDAVYDWKTKLRKGWLSQEIFDRWTGRFALATRPCRYNLPGAKRIWTCMGSSIMTPLPHHRTHPA